MAPSSPGSPSSPRCEFLEWDSAHFGIRIGRYRPVHLDAPHLSAAIDWCRANQVSCLYLLVDHPSTSQRELLEQFHFRDVDLRLTLQRGLAGASCAVAPSVRPAREQDLPMLEAIAADSHIDSRFYRDGHFSRERCDELYRIWIRKSCHGQAQRVWVIDQGAGAAGYCTCQLLPDGTGSIGLIAVSKDFRSQGLGKELVEAALSYFTDHRCERVEVVTQGLNRSATALYQARGFQPKLSQTWFHHWADHSTNATLGGQ